MSADLRHNQPLIILNTDTPTRVPHTTLQQATSPDITTISTTLYNRTNWHTIHAQNSDQLPIITTINTRTKYKLQQNRHPNYRKANWTQFTTDTIFTNIILHADKHNIPKVKIHSICKAGTIQSCSSPTCTSPGQFLQWALFTTNRPLADRHRFTSARRLQCSPFTLALRNNRYERKSTGGFNQHFLLCSPKYRFSHKAPWECRPQFSRCIINISLFSPRPNVKHTRL